jgi:hypothetical protein
MLGICEFVPVVVGEFNSYIGKYWGKFRLAFDGLPITGNVYGKRSPCDWPVERVTNGVSREDDRSTDVDTEVVHLVFCDDVTEGVGGIEVGVLNIFRTRRHGSRW